MKKTRKKDNRRKRIFGISFITAFCTILLVLGVVSADFESRKMGFGDKTPPLSVMEDSEEVILRIYSLGIDKELDVTFPAKLWKNFLEFVCVPTKSK